MRVGVGVIVGVGVSVGVDVGSGVNVGPGVQVGAGVNVGAGVQVGSDAGIGVGAGVGVLRLANCPLSAGILPSSSETETAKPMLVTGLPLSVSSILDELTPITSPLRLTSGPPLLPGFRDASVWSSRTPFSVLVEDMIPRVTVRLVPIVSAMGKPRASTSSPMRTRSESPTAKA